MYQQTRITSIINGFNNNNNHTNHKGKTVSYLSKKINTKKNPNTNSISQNSDAQN